jgi:hypothetical protein
MRHAEKLADPERVSPDRAQEIGVGAGGRPMSSHRAHDRGASIRARPGCLEHARLGFNVLIYLRWEGGDSTNAERYMMMAEEVSRAANEKERVVAMAEAARCLALLERDLPRAAALVLEAEALSAAVRMEPMAIPDALGILRLHEGRLDEAAELFAHARTICRRDGDRLREFQALEHLAWLELGRERYDAAAGLSAELLALGEKLRDGSEAPLAHALAALVRYAQDDEPRRPELDRALESLRKIDAKQRLSNVLLRAAEVDLRRGAADLARTRAKEALRLARMLGRKSECVLAQAVLARAAGALDDGKSLEQELAMLAREDLTGASAEARQAVAALRAAPRQRTRQRQGGT